MELLRQLLILLNILIFFILNKFLLSFLFYLDSAIDMIFSRTLSETYGSF